jgi:uncharacterized protein affecting Mg2+/Co2+ transport
MESRQTKNYFAFKVDIQGNFGENTILLRQTWIIGDKTSRGY